MATVTVLVCRDCCCGRSKKHPDVDHAAQLAAIDDACEAAGNARVVVTRCLDVCQVSNVVVVRHHVPGAPTLWLGKVLTAFQTRALTQWLRAGGPSASPLPAALRPLVFSPSIASACAVDEHCPS
jgi:(2Fe-2S) ferredoxin